MRLSVSLLSLVLLSPMAFAQTAAPAAPAAPPPSAAAMQMAQKIYDDRHLENVFGIMTDNVLEGAMGAAQRAVAERGVQSCPALQAPWNNFVTRMKPILANLADPQFRQSVANLYATSYSESELRDISNFLESPAGKKFLSMDPQLNQQIMTIASEKARPRATQVDSAMADFSNSFKAALATCPASAQAPGAQSQQQPVKKKK